MIWVAVILEPVMHTQATLQACLDDPTDTVSDLVSDPKTHQAAVIEPVLDYDHTAGNVATRSADAILDAAARAGLEIIQVLESHAHADHLSAASHIRERTGAKIGIGRHICQVQRIFRDIFNLTESDVSGHGIEFDQLFDDGDSLMIGELEVHVMHTPGHTPACVAYQ